MLTLAGAGVLVLAGLGLSGKLARNRFVGIRTSASMRDEDAFRVANRVAGPPLLAAGFAMVAVGVLLPLLDGAVMRTLATLAGLVAAVVLNIAGGMLGHRAATALPVPMSDCACCGSSGLTDSGSTAPTAPDTTAPGCAAAGLCSAAGNCLASNTSETSQTAGSA